MATFAPTRLSAEGDFLGNGNLVVLEPERWVGKSFPLSNYMDIGDDVKKGMWRIVLYHYDCPKCQALVTQYEESKEINVDHADIRRIALVEMPPYDPTTTTYFRGPAQQLSRGRLDDNREWFVTAPIEIDIDEGIVTGVNTEPTRAGDRFVPGTEAVTKSY